MQIGKKVKHLILHNWVSNRVRQIVCGWHRDKRHGVTIWYQKVRIYPGYGDCDYEPMLERAARAARLRQKYPGRKVAVLVEVNYSGGRPGIGTRRVAYTIKPYKQVF